MNYVELTVEVAMSNNDVYVGNLPLNAARLVRRVRGD